MRRPVVLLVLGAALLLAGCAPGPGESEKYVRDTSGGFSTADCKRAKSGPEGRAAYRCQVTVAGTAGPTEQCYVHDSTYHGGFEAVPCTLVGEAGTPTSTKIWLGIGVVLLVSVPLVAAITLRRRRS